MRVMQCGHARCSPMGARGEENVCVSDSARDKTPILYKRVILYSHFRSRPVWGGGGLARDFNNQNLIVHLGLGRASR